VWDEDSKEYRTPPQGKAYMAKRYETDAFGVRNRRVQFFASLEKARDWQAGIESRNVISQTAECQKPEVDLGITFGEVVEEWKRRCFPRMAESTRVRYQNLLDLYFQSLLPVHIRAFGPKVVDAWIDELKYPDSWTMKSKKRQTFEHELSVLSTILKYYVNYHDDEAFQFPIKQRHKEASQLNRARKVVSKNLPEAEFLLFRENLAKRKDGLMLAVLATVQYYQALRISEAAALHWEDIYFDWKSPQSSRLKIIRSMVWLRKKGLPAFIKVGFKNADSNEGIKEQPMFPESFDALLKLYREGRKGLIFSRKEKYLVYQWLQKQYDRAFIASGLQYRGTQIMRHGGCSRLFDQEKGDLGLAKQLLGNASYRSVEVYAHRSKTALTEVAAKHWEGRNGLRLAASGCSADPENGNRK
jgi:integrase